MRSGAANATALSPAPRLWELGYTRSARKRCRRSRLRRATTWQVALPPQSMTIRDASWTAAGIPKSVGTRRFRPHCGWRNLVTHGAHESGVAVPVFAELRRGKSLCHRSPSPKSPSENLCFICVNLWPKITLNKCRNLRVFCRILKAFPGGGLARLFLQ